jgi:hypothetical protein
MVHLFADELAGLARWCLALPLGSPRPFDRRFLWHRVLPSCALVQIRAQCNADASKRGK